MHRYRDHFLLLVVFTAAAVPAVGCGEGRLTSPSAPSALPDGAAPATEVTLEASASIGSDESVALRGGGGGQARDDEDSDRDNRREGNGARRRDRELSGFVTAVGADSVTIRGIVVKTVATTVIRHGHRRLRLADIKVGDHAQAKGFLNADGKTLTASEIKVEDTGRGNDDDEEEDEGAEAEVEGVVAGLSGTCPAVRFTIAATSVTTSSSTTFSGVTCAALASGTRVEVHGTLTETTLAAKTVALD
jgi:hypothetical protein